MSTPLRIQLWQFALQPRATNRESSTPTFFTIFDFFLHVLTKCAVRSPPSSLSCNGDSWRASLRPKGLAGIRPLSVKSGFLQTSRIGLVMTWKRHCVLMETLRHGRLGLLRRTRFGSYANLLHPWCFQAKKRFFLTCIPKSGRKNKLFPSIYPHSAGCIYAGTKEEEAGWGQCPDWVATMLRVLVYGTSIGGVVLRQGLISTWGWKVFGHLVLWPTYLKMVALFCLLTSLWKLECLDSSFSGTYSWGACGPQQIGKY